MTKEDKKLLLKDLCARLPYGVIVEIEDEPQTPVQFEWQHLNFIINWEWTIKPYLCLMSSMTDEEVQRRYETDLTTYVLGELSPMKTLRNAVTFCGSQYSNIIPDNCEFKQDGNTQNYKLTSL